MTAGTEDVFMTDRYTDRTGILIVRLWMEPHATDGFRARITQTLDSATDEQKSAMAARPEDVYAAVRTWVEAFTDPTP